MVKIALVGDYDPVVLAHQVIPQALALAATGLSMELETSWIRSAEVLPEELGEFDGLWCVPFSPYRNPERVVEAIHFARLNDLPFLGTCAGYQHAVLEYARNALGYADAASIEDDPETAMPLVSALVCRLTDETDSIRLKSGSFVAGIYQLDQIEEEYHCGFGVNREYLNLFDQSGMTFSGFDSAGDPRILEIRQHRFFIGTAFQPERSAQLAITHPLVRAFLQNARLTS